MCNYILEILNIANQVLLVSQLKVLQYFLTVCPHDTQPTSLPCSLHVDLGKS